MNTFSISRRLSLFLLLVVASLSACKKDADVIPTPTGDLGTQAAGQYTLTELTAGGKTIPAAQADLNGTITVTRVAEATVKLTFNIREKSTGDEVLVGDAAGITLSNSSAGISFKGDNAEVATLRSNKLNVKVVDNSGTEVTFIASK